jgi:hypothetical protein
LSRKGAKSRTGGRKLRSTRTKARVPVVSAPHSQPALLKKLKAHARDLEKKLEARTHDLAEALEQQTATSEVLSVISSSPGELTPVFETILASATRLCDAKFGTLWLYGGNAFHAASLYNAPQDYIEVRKRGPVQPDPRTPSAASPKQSRQCKSPILRWSKLTSRAILCLSPPCKSAAFAPFSPSRC